jgi:hypothetical protein
MSVRETRGENPDRPEARVSFATPWLLLLLIALPLIAWLGWPRYGGGKLRAWISLGLRLLIAMLLVFGMAGVEVRSLSDRLLA